jgi:hypothetical protein
MPSFPFLPILTPSNQSSITLFRTNKNLQTLTTSYPIPTTALQTLTTPWVSARRSINPINGSAATARTKMAWPTKTASSAESIVQTPNGCSTLLLKERPRCMLAGVRPSEPFCFRWPVTLICFLESCFILACNFLLDRFLFVGFVTAGRFGFSLVHP